MERTTRTINTPHGEVLLSPTLAHSLARGDLVWDFLATGNQLRRVARTHRVGTVVQVLFDGAHKPIELGLNRSILRAVGATVGGVL